MVLSQFSVMAGSECIKMYSLLFSPYFFNSGSLYSCSINRPHGLITLVLQLAHLLCADVFQQAVGFTDVLSVRTLLCGHVSFTLGSLCVCGLGHYGVKMEEFSHFECYCRVHRARTCLSRHNMDLAKN